MEKNKILILNAGSSSLKFTVFDQKLKKLLEGNVEKIGEGNNKTDYQVFDGEIIHRSISCHEIGDYHCALKCVEMILEAEKFLFDIDKIGYRVVHGGKKYQSVTVLNKTVLKDLEKVSHLAPLHNPPALAIIKLSMALFKKAKHYAMFDTAFYADLPEESKVYPLSYDLYEKEGIQRYGFHGLSHQHLLEQAAKLLRKPKNKMNLISCHLGSGCSITAIQNGRPIDTSMGFTPMEGLMMSTRGGDIDPGIIIYLQEKLKYSLEDVKNLLNKDSGWLGISGCKDFRDVLLLNNYKVPGYTAKKEMLKKCKRADLALRIFRRRLLKYIGAYSALMPCVDLVVLGGAIGSRSDIIFGFLWNDLKYLRTLCPKLQVLQLKSDEAFVIAKEITQFKNA